MTTHSSPPRPRWYPFTVAALLLTAILLVTAELFGLFPESGPVDGILGFIAGFCATLAAGLVAITEINRRNEALLQDAATLDDLEPLRSAAVGNGSTAPSSSHTDDARR
jgi:hypothetical protein